MENFQESATIVVKLVTRLTTIWRKKKTRAGDPTCLSLYSAKKKEEAATAAIDSDSKVKLLCVEEWSSKTSSSIEGSKCLDC